MSSRSESRTVIGRLLSDMAMYRRRGLYFVSALLLVAVSLCGCVSEPETNGHSSPPPGILLDYHRTGGIAGFDDHLVVFENGDAIISTRKGSGTFALNPDSLKEIKDLMDKAQFTTLNASYSTSSSGADYFRYEVTYQGHTVTTEDTGVPDRLVPVIREMNEIVNAHRS